MRNSLIFGNIEESATRVFEDSEEIIRHFLHDKMKITKDLVESMNFERVHRIGLRSDRKCRKIVAKFASFKDREYVRKQWKTLQGTKFFVIEQFPQEIISKRDRLIPKLKEYKKEGKRAWISYDTLFVEGKPLKTD